MLSLLLLCFVSVCLSQQQDQDEAKLRFYYGATANYKEFPISEAQNVFGTPWYNNNRDTIIFAHGYTGHPEGKAVLSVVEAYLGQSQNVALLNWDRLAAGTPNNLAGTYFSRAAPNARKLGAKFASVLQTLQAFGLNLTRLHLVGHSLGAHVFGVTGNTLSAAGILLPWITGLDPASFDFESRPLRLRLHAGSAEYVDVIHSDPSKYGFRKSTGTVDYWPNYRTNRAVKQPGCKEGSHPMFSTDDLCSHNRCWQLLIDSLIHPKTILASFAKNYRQWKNYSEQERNAVVITLGIRNKEFVPGNYYFITNSESPYGLEKNGLLSDI